MTDTDPVEAATQAVAVYDGECCGQPQCPRTDLAHCVCRASAIDAIAAYRDALEASGDPWPVIRALAAREPQYETMSGDVDCALCTASISLGEPHDPECPYRQARELLSAAPKPTE